MTDTATAQASAEQPTEKPKELKFPDAISKAAYDQIVGLTSERNEQVGKINAVKGDPAALQANLRETSKNPAAVKARAEVERLGDALLKAEAALDEAIKPEFEQARNDAEGSVAKLQEAIKGSDGIIKAAVNYFKKMYPELADHLPKLERLTGMSTSGTASGRRIRGFSVTVKQGDAEPVTYENASGAAKALNVPTADLQAGFFAVIGDKDLKDAPDTVEWKIETVEGEGDDAKTTVVSLTAKRVVEAAASEAPAAEESAA